jgi:hypothetical protein
MEAKRAELQKLKKSELRAVAKGEDIDGDVFDSVLGDAGKGWKDAGVEAILAAQFPQAAQGTLTRDAEADSHGTQPAYLSYETHRVQLVDGTKVKNEWPQHAAAHTACMLYHPKDTSELHLYADIAAVQELMPAFNRGEQPLVFDIVPVESKSHLLHNFREHLDPPPDKPATRDRTAFFVFWAGRASTAHARSCRTMQHTRTLWSQTAKLLVADAYRRWSQEGRGMDLQG